MHSLRYFIENNEVLSTKNLIKVEELKEFEKELSINFGLQLKKYIMEYGFLAYEHVELYGVNSKQCINSDMIKVSQMLHENYPITKTLIALENRGEGDYILIDEDDNVFEFDLNISSELVKLDKKMFDYILERFMECNN